MQVLPPQKNTSSLIAGLSNGSSSPRGSGQPVARQHKIHLSPLQHAESNPGCAFALESVRLSVHGGGRTVVNTPMQNPDAVGQKLAITELEKLMLYAKKRLT